MKINKFILGLGLVVLLLGLGFGFNGTVLSQLSRILDIVKPTEVLAGHPTTPSPVGQLTIVKNAIGGDGTEVFNFFVSSVATLVNITGSDRITMTVPAGPFSIREILPPLSQDGPNWILAAAYCVRPGDGNYGSAPQYCGDGTCNVLETCEIDNCPSDCGNCAFTPTQSYIDMDRVPYFKIGNLPSVQNENFSNLVLNLVKPIEVLAQNPFSNSPISSPGVNGGIIPNENTTCFFFNVKQGSLNIIKETTGGDKDAWFNYAVALEKNALYSLALDVDPSSPFPTSLEFPFSDTFNNFPTVLKKGLVVIANTLKTAAPNYTGNITTYLDPNTVAPNYTGNIKTYLDPGKYRILEEARDAEGWTLKDVSCDFISPLLPPPPTCGKTPTICDAGFGGENCNNCPSDCPIVLPLVCPSPLLPQSTGILRGDGIDNVLITPGGTTTCTFKNSGQGVIKIVTDAIGVEKDTVFKYVIKRYEIGSPSATTNTLDVATNRLIRKDLLRGDEWLGDKTIDVDKGITAYTITQEISQESGTEGVVLNSVECEIQYKDSASPTGVHTIYSYGVNSVTVRGGRTTTCTFNNTKKGELKIIKNVPSAVASAPVSGTPPTIPRVPPVPAEKFNFDINFVSTNYFNQSVNILPFAIKSEECGPTPAVLAVPAVPATATTLAVPEVIGVPEVPGTCGLDEDCTICRTDCGPCSSPKPGPLGPGYSPSRMTVKANEDGTKRIYPGTYQITEYFPTTVSPPLPPPLPGSPPPPSLPPPDGEKIWVLNKVSCEVSIMICTTPPNASAPVCTQQKTGQKTGNGVSKLDVYAGKTTTCTFENVLRAPEKGFGAGGSFSGEGRKPTGEEF